VLLKGNPGQELLQLEPVFKLSFLSQGRLLFILCLGLKKLLVLVAVNVTDAST
jgi:hypothetical protein